MSETTGQPGNEGPSNSPTESLNIIPGHLGGRSWHFKCSGVVRPSSEGTAHFLDTFGTGLCYLPIKVKAELDGRRTHSRGAEAASLRLPGASDRGPDLASPTQLAAKSPGRPGIPLLHSGLLRGPGPSGHLRPASHRRPALTEHQASHADHPHSVRAAAASALPRPRPALGF